MIQQYDRVSRMTGNVPITSYKISFITFSICILLKTNHEYQNLMHLFMSCIYFDYELMTFIFFAGSANGIKKTPKKRMILYFTYIKTKSSKTCHVDQNIH